MQFNRVVSCSGRSVEINDFRIFWIGLSVAQYFPNYLRGKSICFHDIGGYSMLYYNTFFHVDLLSVSADSVDGFASLIVCAIKIIY